MKILSTNEKGNVAIIFNEEEIATIINMSKNSVGEEQAEPEVKKDLPVKIEKPLSGMQKNTKEFIEAVYDAFKEGVIIKLDNPIFMNIRKSYFIVNLTHVLVNLNKRGIASFDVADKSFMFIKSPKINQ